MAKNYATEIASRPRLDEDRGGPEPLSWIRSQDKETTPAARVRPEKKVRVLQILSRLNIGGPSIHAVLLSAGLDAHRFESKLIVGKEGPREGNILELAYARGVRVDVLSSLGRDVRPIQDLVSLFRLVRRIRSERPDIVCTHTAKAGALGRIAAWLSGVPVVVHTFHGSVFEGYFGPMTSQMYQHAERLLSRITDVAVAVSPRVKEEIERRGVTPRRGVVVIPLGLDLEQFAAHPRPSGILKKGLNLSPAAILIGCAGRLVPIKDLTTLIGALSRVRERLPETHLIVGGDGLLREALEAKCAALGLSGKVHFLGFRTDMPVVYSDLDVMVNCSLNEGTPVSLIEAMAAGVPVVGTRVGGTPDLLQNGRLGRLVPARDPKALATTLLDVLTRRDETASRCREAREAVLERYASRRLLNDMERLYRSLLKKESLPTSSDSGSGSARDGSTMDFPSRFLHPK